MCKKNNLTTCMAIYGSAISRKDYRALKSPRKKIPVSEKFAKKLSVSQNLAKKLSDSRKNSWPPPRYQMVDA